MRIEHWLYTVPLRLRSLFRRERVEDELNEELRYHIEQKTEQYIAAGVNPEEARRAALCDMDGLERHKEECRDMRRVNFIEDLVKDLQFGVRQLRRNPGFTAVAVITLALGIGANTAIFSVVDTVLLRPLPYKDPSSLVWATERFGFNHGAAGVISPDYIGWEDHNQVFERIGASGGGAGADLTGAGQAARVSITDVTVSYFPMLGVRPVIGRTFLASEGKQGQNHVALLSETLWRNQFGADPRIVGRTIRLDDAAYTVVGVMPASFRSSADLWTPFALDEPRFSPHSPMWAILTVIARLKPAVGVSQAEADLQVITQRMDKQYPPQAAQFRAHERVEVIPLHELFVHNVRSLLLILLGAVGLVFLIACANVANLLLSRGVVRSKEMAVRAALGARHVRLIRQLLTEGLLLAAAGSVLGVLAGISVTNILKQLIPANLPSDIHLDLRFLGFSAAIAVLAVLLFGFIPALIASRMGVSEVLKEGVPCAGASPTAHRLRNLMSAGEIALSLILLVGAGLLARSFVRLAKVELGFNPHGLLIATIQRPRAVFYQSHRHTPFFHDALERIRSLPGVQNAALTSQYPLGPPHNGTLILNVRGERPVHPQQGILVTAISRDYFRVMGMRLLKGRAFGEEDGAEAQPVAIVNGKLARIVFNGRDPLGKHIGTGPPPQSWMELVGVVSDTRSGALEEDPGPELFVPYSQQPSYVMTFVLRTRHDPDALSGALRNAIQQIDRNQPVFDVATMDDVIANSLAPRRFKMLLLGLFALLALTLAAVGIYGVMAYFCSQRIHEFGIRLALGAEARDILKLVVGQALKITLAGIAAGIVGALALTRLMAGLLYDVTPADPLTLFAMSLMLTLVALLASYIPARRATRVAPMVALRHE